MEIQNTNLKLKNGCYIISYCPSGTSNGYRIIVLTYDYKKTVKKYNAAGYYLFGNPSLFNDGYFFALTKNFKQRTQNKNFVTIGNEMYHIEKALNQGRLTIDVV